MDLEVPQKTHSENCEKTYGQGLNFTAAEVGAQAAGLAAMEVLQTLQRPRHKVIKAPLGEISGLKDLTCQNCDEKNQQKGHFFALMFG